MAAVDDALAEINAAIAVIEPQLEGLRDYDRLNIMQPAQNEITAALTDFQMRYDLLVSARTILENLLAHGYPDMPTRMIPGDAYADLAANNQTIDAAFAVFTPAVEPESLRLAAGAPQPK